MDGVSRLDSRACGAEDEQRGLGWLSEVDVELSRKHFFGIALVRAPLADSWVCWAIPPCSVVYQAFLTRPCSCGLTGKREDYS